MTRELRAAGEKPLEWVVGTRKELAAFPDEVRRGIGKALEAAQFGGKHLTAKPWKGDGSGVLEVVEDHRGDTYRAVYTVRFEKAVYVLHVFQKKSKTGIKTDRRDQELITSRLRAAELDYKEKYG
jgi:phage-related protein